MTESEAKEKSERFPDSYRRRARFLLWLESKGYKFSPYGNQRRVLRLAYKRGNWVKSKWGYGFEDDWPTIYYREYSALSLRGAQSWRLWHYCKWLFAPVALYHLYRWEKAKRAMGERYQRARDSRTE